MTIDVALFGFGLAGAMFHAPLIMAESRLRLTRVVSSRPDDVRKTHPQALVSRHSEAVLSDPAVQLVVITTPNHTHASLARDALLAGKHVVVDKPFVTDTADAADLIRLARDRGRMLTIFHNRRWDGDFLTVTRLVKDGCLGDISLAEMRWDRLRPQVKQGWREVPAAGAGLLADLGPHLIDQALRLFGFPDAIGGDVACQRTDALVDDYFEITLHYGAKRVILSASTLVAAPRPRFALHGSEASFVKYGIDPQEAKLRAGGSPRDLDYGVDRPEDHGTLTSGAGSRRIPTETGDWRIFYERVADAIIDGAAPPVDPGDALAGLSLIESAHRSARDGRLMRVTPAPIL